MGDVNIKRTTLLKLQFSFGIKGQIYWYYCGILLYIRPVIKYVFTLGGRNAESKNCIN